MHGFRRPEGGDTTWAPTVWALAVELRTGWSRRINRAADTQQEEGSQNRDFAEPKAQDPRRILRDQNREKEAPPRP
jgi:hypothetical protein